MEAPPDTSWGKLLALIPEGGRVLDVGCAFGLFSAAIKQRRRCAVVGIEIDPGMAAAARQHCDEVLQGDALQIVPSLPRDFDVVIAADVLEHLPDPSAMLQALRGVLKSGGALLASIPNITHASIVLELARGRFPRSREGLLDETHIRFWGEAELLQLFCEAGFAARVADRVRMDPRLTEFRSDLLDLAPEVIEFLARNPNSDTYQFIVRAVPKDWAGPGDEQTAPAGPAGEANFARTLRTQLDELHEKLSTYHRALTAERETLRSVQQEFEDHRGKASVMQESAEGRLWARRIFRLGPLNPDERDALRVLYVSDRADAPFRYRVLHAVEQLRDAGIAANAVALGSPECEALLPTASLVVLFRLGWSQPVAALAEAARAAGAKLALDVDDLVFDAGAGDRMPFLRRFTAEKIAAYRREFEALAQTLRAVDVCIASTPTIARYARAAGIPAITHPNLLSREQLRLAKLAAPMRRILLKRPLLSYLSGSNTHDGDLARIAPVLDSVLRERSEIRLAVCGFARLPGILSTHRDRVIRLPYLDRRVYPWIIARSSAVLAPIEEINDFAHGKSALKVFEAGALGVPAVAAPTLPYEDAIQQGVSGFIAVSDDDWRSALLAICADEASLSLGAQARRIALEEHSCAGNRWVLARRLLGWAGKPRSRALPQLLPLDPRSLPAVAAEASRIARRSVQVALAAGASTATHAPADLEPSSPERARDLAGWVATAKRDGFTLSFVNGAMGVLLVSREASLLPTNGADLEHIGGREFRATGVDPRFEFDGWHLSMPPRTIVVELSATTADGFGNAQLFWSEGQGEPFSESASLQFSFPADGRMHAVAIQLPKVDEGMLPPRVARVRFDPIDRPGSFRVDTLAIAGELPAGRPNLREALAARFLSGNGLEIGALHNPLPVSAAARVRYVDRLPIEELRAHYPELAEHDLVAPSVLASGEDLSPIPDESESFVICNHVLEHMRDPLHSLSEWLRVLKSGGHLYVSIPDRGNPHDRRRPLTTFEHLQADAAGRGRKGEEVDLAAFHEWAHSAHAEDMNPEQREQHARELIARDYSIHFHVFDRVLFERTLEHACAAQGASLVEFQEAPLDGYFEYIAVLRKEPRRRGVDVVVPIYNARDWTRRCLESVLRHGSGDFRLVAIDDCSSDRGVMDDLRALAARDRRVAILENPSNLGFVGTANRGMRQAKGRDVLLLNSDTEVFGGFLDQLRSAAYAHEETGIVTPFSNNATIFSIPEQGENPIPSGHTAASVAQVVTAASRRLRPEMPTAVGFCMYIRAEVLERVGLFDEGSFGRGFGEENDLCQRARAAGFKIRLCDDAFVWHKGKASFGQEGGELERRNEEILRRKHPRYAPEIAHFCRTDPLSPLRRELAFHLRRLREGAQGAALFLLHASPFSPTAGGTEHHVRQLVAALRLPRAVLMWVEGAEIIAGEVLDGDVSATVFYRYALSQRPKRFAISNSPMEQLFAHLLDVFGIRWAHLHHLMFWPVSLGRVLKSAGIPYVATVHDYFYVCPSWNLYDFGNGRRCPCPMPDGRDAGCVPAFLEQSRLLDQVDAAPATLRLQHRAASLETLRNARAVIVPSHAALHNLRTHLDLGDVRLEVLAHGYGAVISSPRPAEGARLRIAILGEVAYPLKGATAYLELMRSSRDLPLEWHVFGNVDRFGYADKLRAIGLGDRLLLHGPYDRGEIVNRLVATGVDLCVLLPEWDETFSYTLSESTIAGIPVLVSERGALAERVTRDDMGIVARTMDEAVETLRRLTFDRTALAPYRQRLEELKHRTLAENAAAHEALYQQLGFERSLSAELRSEWLHELSDKTLSTSDKHAVVPLPPSRPAWRNRIEPALKQLRPFLPSRVRRAGRTILQYLSAAPPITLREPHAIVGVDGIKRSGGHAELQISSNDPQLIFDVRPFQPGRYGELRFRLRRHWAGVGHAQLFWRSESQPGFSERSSALIALDGPPGEWREYSIRLDDHSVVSNWRSDKIVQLRFDPSDVPGRIEMGPLVLQES